MLFLEVGTFYTGESLTVFYQATSDSTGGLSKEFFRVYLDLYS